MTGLYCPECEGELRERYGLLHCSECRRAWFARNLAPVTATRSSGRAHDAEHERIEQLRQARVATEGQHMHRRLGELERFAEALVRHLTVEHGHRAVAGAEMETTELLQLHATDHQPSALPTKPKRGKK